MDKLLYGVAYYDEYIDEERLAEDIRLMKEANINLVRIAESTWSTHEPQDNVFDFSSVAKVLDAMHEAGIYVIIGTPTYAVPTWLVKKHPEVMVTNGQQQLPYGARQIMDITSPAYLFHAERIIRKLMAHTAQHPAVIGFQVDNETKHYGTSSENVQIAFVKYLKEQFNSDLDALNKEFGLSYWSNRINAWEDFPSVVGTINGSLGAEFSKFQRQLVTDFLGWQAAIVKEYANEEQFVTHNFDFEWRNYSFGIQPDVNHFEASKVVDITGVDVYHPTQEELTGIEIAFAGDVARTTKEKNYFVLETEAQAFKQWTPYPGQLRLQAFSHVASGASMVEYWHWHSIHNSYETYWKGLLSHDFQPNPVYNEAKQIGKEFNELSESLMGLKKQNKVALIVSNESLTGIDWFPYMGHQMEKTATHQYNDVVRAYYDELFKLNVEVDILQIGDPRIKNYKMLVIPCLYSASDQQLEEINDFVEAGGTAIVSFKSGFSNEHLKVRSTTQPGILTKSCGVEYQLFSEANDVKLASSDLPAVDGVAIDHWMELLVPTTASSLATYQHKHWGEYAAITENNYGEGLAYYVGTFIDSKTINSLLVHALKRSQLWTERQEQTFPVITKCATNKNGEEVEFYFNYSDDPITARYMGESGLDLLANKQVNINEEFTLEPWGMRIIKK